MSRRKKQWFETEGEIDPVATARLSKTMGELVDNMPRQRKRRQGMQLSSLIVVIQQHPKWRTRDIAEYFLVTHQAVSLALNKMTAAGVHHGYAPKVYSMKSCGIRHHSSQPCEKCDGLTLTFEEKFWAKFDFSGDCWLWTGGTRAGYGAVGKKYVHHVAYELANGAPAKGYVLHKCSTPLCGNPKHLVDGSQADNVNGNKALGLKPRRPRALKTHCKRGHEFTPGSHYQYGSNRQCKLCVSNRQRARYQRLKRERQDEEVSEMQRKVAA